MYAIAQKPIQKLVWWPVVAVQAVAIVAAMLAIASGVGAQAPSGSYTDLQEAGIHSTAIEALAADGIFDGTECDIESFCPGDGLKRWIAAVWLVRAVDTTEPTVSDESQFADVDGSNWWSAHVNRLAELEVTNGCDTDNFCPDNVVSRSQIATFLYRSFSLPAAPAAGFTDIAGNVHEDAINALAAAGIISGCSSDPLRYCPDTSVTRAQTATLISRTLQYVASAEDASSAAVPTPASSQTSQAGQGQQARAGQPQSSNQPTNTGTNNPPMDSNNANQANQSTYLFGGFGRVAASGSNAERTIELYGALPCPAYETATAAVSPGTGGASKKITATYRVKDTVFDKYGMDFACAAIEVPFGPWKVSLGSGIDYPFTVQLTVRQIGAQADPNHITYTCNRTADCTSQ